MLRSRSFPAGGDEPSTRMAGCGIFLLSRWPSSLGYRPLVPDVSAAVTVVVGKEEREFLVDPVVLERDLFRVLLRVARRRDGEHGRRGGGAKRKRGRGAGARGGGPIFVDVDAILFEHMLWLAENGEGEEEDGGGPSLLQGNLREIIEFYAQDC